MRGTPVRVSPARSRRRRRSSSSCRARCSRSAQRGLPPDGSFQLGLRHLRAAFDVLLTRFVVELIAGPPTGTAVRAQPAASTRRDVVERRRTGLARFSGPRAFLVDGPGRDLFRGVFGLTAVAQPVLDVFVLTFALVA